MISLARFGSECRGELDKDSDRDILVVCPTILKKMISSGLQRSGYNVTALTRDQLIYMQEKGALFIQHIKLEGQIIFDFRGKLRSFLNQAKLKKPNEGELKKCENSIQFISRWPNLSTLGGWKSDVLFCLSRDYLIKMLACREIMVFGLKDIERAAMNTFGFEKDEIDCLWKLRSAKVAYRTSKRMPEAIVNDVSGWVGALRRRVIKDPGNENAVDLREISERRFSSGYERLRVLEGIYLIAKSRGYQHPAYERIIKLISYPNHYGSARGGKQQEIMKYTREIMSGLMGLNLFAGCRDVELSDSDNGCGGTRDQIEAQVV